MFVYLGISFLSGFFFNDTATTEIYTLSLHDALPILPRKRILRRCPLARRTVGAGRLCDVRRGGRSRGRRSEEHTSELQSQSNLVCRLLLEKKKASYSKLMNLFVSIRPIVTYTALRYS